MLHQHAVVIASCVVLLYVPLVELRQLFQTHWKPWIWTIRISEPMIVDTRRQAPIWCKKSRTSRCKDLVTPMFHWSWPIDRIGLLMAEETILLCTMTGITRQRAFVQYLYWFREIFSVEGNCFSPFPLHGQEIYEKQKRLGRLWLYFADRWDDGSTRRQKCPSHAGSNQQNIKRGIS